MVIRPTKVDDASVVDGTVAFIRPSMSCFKCGRLNRVVVVVVRMP